MQRRDATHDAGQRLGNSGIGGVSVMEFAIHFVAVNRGMESLSDLTKGAREFDQRLALRHSGHLKAFGGDPMGNGLNVRIGSTEPRTELFGGDPLVISRRSKRMYVFHVLCQGGLAVGWAIQQQQ